MNFKIAHSTIDFIKVLLFKGNIVANKMDILFPY